MFIKFGFDYINVNHIIKIYVDSDRYSNEEQTITVKTIDGGFAEETISIDEFNSRVRKSSILRDEYIID
jgi:hypothetical protein